MKKKKQELPLRRQQQASDYRLLPVIVMCSCMILLLIVLILPRQFHYDDDTRSGVDGSFRRWGGRGSNQMLLKRLLEEIENTMKIDSQPEYISEKEKEAFPSLTILLTNTTKKSEETPEQVDYPETTPIPIPKPQIRWTTISFRDETCVTACHKLSSDMTATNTNPGDEGILMCDQKSLNSIRDADAMIIAANAANRNCEGNPEPLYKDKSKNRNDGIFKLAPYINKGSGVCFFAVPDNEDTIEAQSIQKCDEKNEAGRERLCPCKTRESVFQSIAKTRHLYSIGDYQSAFDTIHEQDTFEYCYAPEEIDSNINEMSTTLATSTTLDKILCNISELYHEEGRLYDAYALLDSLPVKHNVSLDSISEHNKWVMKLPLTVEQLLDEENEEEEMKEIDGEGKNIASSELTAYDGLSIIYPVEYGKGRIQSTSLCKHYVYSNIHFRVGNDTKEELNDSERDKVHVEWEERWANQTFELPLMRDWYRDNDLDVPELRGIRLYVFEAEENSIPKEWQDLQSANRGAATNIDEYGEDQGSSLERNHSSSSRRMDRLSFLLGADLFDDKGDHFSIHTPLTMSEGIDFYISNLTSKTQTGEDLVHSGLHIPLMLNRYHTADKKSYVAAYNGWGGQLNDHTQILATLSGDMTPFLDSLTSENHQEEGLQNKIWISHVSIVALQNFGEDHVHLQSAGARILSTFDLELCSPGLLSSVDDDAKMNDISIGVSMYLFNMEDPYMESDQTKLWWQKHLYLFIEYYRIVHNITRIYIYGENVVYRELLRDYIASGIVLYIEWPFAFDIGDGDIVLGNQRARNFLGKAYPGRSDLVLYKINQVRIQMKTLWRARAARSRWHLNIDFDEFFVTTYNDKDSSDQSIRSILDRAEKLFPKICSLYFERRSLGDGLHEESRQYHFWQNGDKFGRASGINNFGTKTVIHPDSTLQMHTHHSVCMPSMIMDSNDFQETEFFNKQIVDTGRLKSMDMYRIGVLEYVLDNKMSLSHWDYKERMKHAVFIHGLVSSLDHSLSGESGIENERDIHGLPIMKKENSNWSELYSQYAMQISSDMVQGFVATHAYDDSLESLT